VKEPPLAISIIGGITLNSEGNGSDRERVEQYFALLALRILVVTIPEIFLFCTASRSVLGHTQLVQGLFPHG
jgi:hypothetical protein